MIGRLRPSTTARRAAAHDAGRWLYCPRIIEIIHRPEEIEASGGAGQLGREILIKGAFKPLGGRHGGRAQDPLCHSQQNARVTAERRWRGSQDKMKRCLRSCARAIDLRPWERKWPAHPRTGAPTEDRTSGFVDPQCPWPARQQHENTNVCCASSFPKGTDLSTIQPDQPSTTSPACRTATPPRPSDGKHRRSHGRRTCGLRSNVALEIESKKEPVDAAE